MSICHIWAAVWFYQEAFEALGTVQLLWSCSSCVSSSLGYLRSIHCEVFVATYKHTLHFAASVRCALLYFHGNLDFHVISDQHIAWLIHLILFAWFCFLLQVQREAEEISNGLGLYIYSYFNLDIRRFFPLIRVLLLFHHSMRCFLFDVVYNKVAFEVGMLWTIVIDFEKNMHGGMASQLKLLQITSGTVRLHFFLDLWHPCPCRMRRWRRWWSPWRAPWTQPWRRRKHYNDLDYDYDNHDDNHHDDDYCIVDYSGCGMHYDSRCDT